MNSFRVSLSIFLVFLLVFSIGVVPKTSKTEASVNQTVADEPLWFGAAGSPYYPDSASYPPDIEITSLGDNHKACLKLDNDGYPHIAWVSSYLQYIHWDGKNWVCIDGSIYDPSIHFSRNPANISGTNRCKAFVDMEIDSKGYPHLTWEMSGGNGEIYYIKWNGINWVSADETIYNSAYPSDANIDNNIFGGNKNSAFPKLALDNYDRAHLVWTEWHWNSDWDIIYIRWDGLNWVCADGSIYDGGESNYQIKLSNANVSINSGKSYQPSITLDNSNNPHLVWYDNSLEWENLNYYQYEIFYTYWNGSKWVCADKSEYNMISQDNNNPVNVSNNIGESGLPCIVLDDKSNPHISWHDKTFGNAQVMYVKLGNDSKWTCIDESIYNPTIGNANISNTAGNSFCVTINLDTNNYPHFSWHDTNNGQYYDVMYLLWDGFKLVCIDGDIYNPNIGNANVSNLSSEDSLYPSICVDEYGGTHIAWNQTVPISDERLFYVTSNPNIGYHITSNSYNISTTKDLELDGNNDYLDFGRDVSPGDILTYRINVTAELGDPDSTVPVMVEDVIPYGTEYADYMNPCSSDVFSHSIYNYTQGTCEKEGKWCWDEIPGELAAFKHSGIVLRWRLNLKHDETVSLIYKVKVLDGVDKVYSPSAIVRMYDRTDDIHSNHLLNNVVSYRSLSINVIEKNYYWEYVPKRLPIGTKMQFQWGSNLGWFGSTQLSGWIKCSIRFKTGNTWTNWQEIKKGNNSTETQEYLLKDKKGSFYIDPKWLPDDLDSIECELRIEPVNMSPLPSPIPINFGHAYATITRYPALNHASWIDPFPDKKGRTPLILIHGFSFFGNRAPISESGGWNELLSMLQTKLHGDEYVFERYKPYILSYDSSSSWLWNYIWKEMDDIKWLEDFDWGEWAAGIDIDWSGIDWNINMGWLDVDWIGGFGVIASMLFQFTEDGLKDEAMKVRYMVQKDILNKNVYVKYDRYGNKEIDYERLGNDFSPSAKTIRDIGQKVAEEINYLIDNDEFPCDENFVIIGHSLGGIIGRSIMDSYESFGRQFGHRVDKLITLASPHHGTPFANTNWSILSPSVDNPGYVLKNTDETYKWKKPPSKSALEYSAPLVQDLAWDNYDKNKVFKYDNTYLGYINNLHSNKIGETWFDKIFAYACDLEYGVDFLNLTPENIEILIDPLGGSINNKLQKILGEEIFEQLSETDIAKISASCLTGNGLAVGATILMVIYSHREDYVLEWVLSNWSTQISKKGNQYINNDGVIPLSSTLFDGYLEDYQERTFEGDIHTNKTVLNHKSINSTKSKDVFKNIVGDLFYVMPTEIENCIIKPETMLLKIGGYYTSPVLMKLTYENEQVYKKIYHFHQMKKYDDEDDAMKRLLTVEIPNDVISIIFNSLVKSTFDNYYLASSYNYSSYISNYIPKSVSLGVNLSSVFNSKTYTNDFNGYHLSIPIELEIPNPSLRINVWTDGYQYYKDDIITCKLRVSNIGLVPTINNQITLRYPRELILLSSRPSGNIGQASWSDEIKIIDSGKSIQYELKFRVDRNVNIGENTQTISFLGGTSSLRHSYISDSSQVLIIPQSSEKTLSLFIEWNGIDTKTSEGNVGEEISLNMIVEGGSSPYEIDIDWGDGEKSFVSEIKKEANTSHIYSSSGDYSVVIKLTDTYGKTKFVERILHIE